MNPGIPPTIGLVLAGGLATRMGGGDKALLKIGGRTILSRVLARLSPYCESIVLNANGDPSRFSDYGLPVIADSVPDFAGPLAGILAGMEWARTHRPEIEWIATAPGDSPFLPEDLVPRLHHAARIAERPVACCKSGEWRHPATAIWRTSLYDDLREALIVGGLRKMEVWADRHGVAIAEWPDEPFDYFFNVNRPEDLRDAELVVEHYPAAR